MAVIQQMRHKCYGRPPQLHVFISRKSAFILTYDSLECYGNWKTTPACFGGWHGIIFHTFIRRIWWLVTSKDKIHNRGLVTFQTRISFKVVCSTHEVIRFYSPKRINIRRQNILNYNESDWSSKIQKLEIDKINMIKIYVIQQCNATLYYIKYKYKWQI